MTTTYSTVFKDWCLDFIRPASQCKFEKMGEYYIVKGLNVFDVQDAIFFEEKGSLNERDYQAIVLVNKIYRTARKCFVVGCSSTIAFLTSNPLAISNLLSTSIISIIGILHTQPSEINFSPGAAKITMLMLQNAGLAVIGNTLGWGIKALF